MEMTKMEMELRKIHLQLFFMQTKLLQIIQKQIDTESL